jgi:hypothetical protein
MALRHLTMRTTCPRWTPSQDLGAASLIGGTKRGEIAAWYTRGGTPASNRGLLLQHVPKHYELRESAAARTPSCYPLALRAANERRRVEALARRQSGKYAPSDMRAWARFTPEERATRRRKVLRRNVANLNLLGDNLATDTNYPPLGQDRLLCCVGLRRGTCCFSLDDHVCNTPLWVLASQSPPRYLLSVPCSCR